MKIYEHIHEIASSYLWSTDIDSRHSSREIYYAGLNAVDGYRGDPEQLETGLRILMYCPARSYAFAGVSYTLIAASYIQGSNYEHEGLQLAKSWLNRAQSISPNTADIDFVQLYIDIGCERYDKLFVDLEQFEPEYRIHFHVQLAKLKHLLQTTDIEAAEKHYERLLTLCQSKNQTLAAHRQMMHYYLNATGALINRAYETNKSTRSKEIRSKASKGIKIMKDAAPFSKDDPWFWHNYSLLFLHKHDYHIAAKYNKRALRLMDFQAARNVQDILKEVLSVIYYLA